MGTLYKLAVGNVCNNNCIYCNANKEDKKFEKSFEDIKSELENLKKENIDAIHFPCNADIRKDFLKILKFTKQLGFKISLESNGRMFYYKSFCERVKKMGIDYCYITLNSHLSKLHDKITNVEGSYRQTINGIKNLIDLDINPIIDIYITKFNFTRLPKFVEFLIKLKISGVNFVFSDDNMNIIPKISEVEQYINKTLKFQNKIFINIINVPFCFFPELTDIIINVFNYKRIKTSDCNKCILKYHCDGVFESYINSVIKKIKPLELPLEVKIELTSKCNFNCYFCFNLSAFPKRDVKKLTTKQWVMVLDKLKEEGIQKIRFTGGEPFLRKDLFYLLEYAKSKGFYVKLNTYGEHINEKNIKKLEKYVDEILLPLHSVSGKDEKRIMGEDLFRKKIEAIKLLNKSKIKLLLDTIAVRENIINLPKFFDFIKKLNVKNWFLALPIPNSTRQLINNEDIELLVDSLIDLNAEYNKNYYLCHAIPFCSYDPNKIYQIAVGAMTCGPHTVLVIDPTGEIKFCYPSKTSRGNILEVSLKEIWNSEICQNIRNLKNLPSDCKNCKFLYRCKGGCRFAAELINKSTNALDPLAQPEKFEHN